MPNPNFFNFIKCQIYTSFYVFTYSEPIFFSLTHIFIDFYTLNRLYLYFIF